MKLFFTSLLCLIFTPFVHAMDYTATIKGGWGEARLNPKYGYQDSSFSDEGYSLAYGAGLVFDNNLVTGLEIGLFTSDSFLGSHDRVKFSEYKWSLGYRVDVAPHFRVTPTVGISHWDLRAKKGASGADEELIPGTYHGNDAYGQINIEFPINSLVAIVSSFNYTKYNFGVIRTAQAGVIFQF